MNRNKLRNDIVILKEKLAEMEEDLIKTDKGWGTSTNCEWYINTAGNVVFTGDSEYITSYIIENYNAFTSKEKAEEIAEKQLLWRKLQRFADENNEEFKAYYYEIWVEDDEDLRVISSYSGLHCVGTVIFSSEEIAEKALKTFRTDLEKCYK